MREANRELTLSGIIVLAPGEMDGAVSEDQKAVLDALHLRKIDLADRILVVSPDGRIGESTSAEIAHARAAGKPVSFTHPGLSVSGNTPPNNRFADKGDRIAGSRPKLESGDSADHGHNIDGRNY